MTSDTPNRRTDGSRGEHSPSEEEIESLAELFAIVNQQGEEGWRRLEDGIEADVDPLPEERLRELAREAIQRATLKTSMDLARERASHVLDKLRDASKKAAPPAAGSEELERLVNDLRPHASSPDHASQNSTPRPKAQRHT